ncbi:MAG TPA: ABC-2 family transporter protein [Patescibacteria group bacterium]
MKWAAVKPYLQVAKNTWNNALTYRINVLLWRFRMVLQLLATYFLWLAVIPANKTVLGYSQSAMLTYVLASAVISAIVFSSLVGAVGEEINKGDLSNYLLKPVNYFAYWLARDAGDKAMNICFAVVEITLIILILRPPVFLQANLLYVFLSIVSVVMAILLYFLMNFLLGLIGFWSSEVWAPRFIFFTIYAFFSGGIFPLDILPKPFFIFFQILPFPYLLYFPIKLYLGQLSILEIILGFLASGIWLFLLFKFLQWGWQKGLKQYTAQGR